MLRGKWVPPNLVGRFKDPEKDAVEAVYFIMRHMGWSYSEVMNLPIPAYMEIVKLAEKELKEQERQTRSGKWHKR